MNTKATHVRKAGPAGRWEGVERLAYKRDGDAPFRDVTRQVLFDAVGGASQWRYFEVAPGGHTTLERHQHTHAVMVLRGRGRCLLGDRIYPLGPHDLVEVPAATWHQFRPEGDEPLGFLCLVAQDRDRPELPDPAALAGLRALPDVAAFLDS
ncbi:MAG: cupin domain-containing protein [Burkholderiaceae bacterium]